MSRIHLLIFFVLFTQSASAMNDKYYFNNHKQLKLYPISIDLRSYSKIDYYKNENNIKLGITNKLIIKFKKINHLNKYLNDFNLHIVKYLKNNTYLLSTENKSLTIDISNKLYKKSDVIFSHPDFIKKRIRR